MTKAEYDKIWQAKNRAKLNALARLAYQKNRPQRQVSMAKYRHLKGVNLRNASLQKIGLTGQVSGDQINFSCFKAEE
jgi:hypothetical protein